MFRLPLLMPALLMPALLVAFATSAAAQTVPTGFVIDTLVSTGLSTPNDCCFLPDGRCLIANSAGGVTLFASGTAVSIGTVPAVESGGERGLLSIAADPAFASNGVKTLSVLTQVAADRAALSPVSSYRLRFLGAPGADNAGDRGSFGLSAVGLETVLRVTYQP